MNKKAFTPDTQNHGGPTSSLILSALINSSMDLIWSVDKELRLVAANKAFLEHILQSSGIMLKPQDSLLDPMVLPGGDKEQWKSWLSKGVEGEALVLEEYLGKPFEAWAEISIHPINEKEIQGASCFMKNISARKLSQKKRNKKIKKMLLRNRDLEQFSYIISHNLRSPMANIRGLSTIMQTHQLDPESYMKCVKGLESSVKRLDEIIIDLNQILQVKGESAEQKSVVDFSELTLAVSDNIRHLIDQENVRIVTDFSRVTELYTVKSYMHSIFYNLISNSIKYRKDNESPIIHISSWKEEKKVVLTFVDNGAGIDMALYGDKVFGLYKRFHPDIEGKGVGLFMVKTQVETLGGSISISSDLGKGTEFRIEFGH
jgi:signal transduction histidine kinase